MEQNRLAGISLLVLAGVAAVLAAISMYNVNSAAANDVDRMYAWGAVVLTIVLGVWGIVFLRKAPPLPKDDAPKQM